MLTVKAILSLVLLTRYINEPITLRYGTFGPIFLHYHFVVEKYPLSERATIRVLNGCALSMWKHIKTPLM